MIAIRAGEKKIQEEKMNQGEGAASDQRGEEERKKYSHPAPSQHATVQAEEPSTSAPG